MTGAPAGSDAALASAVIDATLIVVEAPLGLPVQELAKIGGSVEPLDQWPRSSHPLLLEFWDVSHGRMSPFGIEDGVWLDLVSATWGAAAALSTPALAAITPIAAGVARLSRATLGSGKAWADKAFGSYHELLCGIPNVRVDGLNEPALLVYRMFTDSPFARIIDKALGYGFGKQAARFSASPEETQVFSPAGRLVASFRVDDSKHDVAPEQARFRPDALRWLRQRLLGQAPDVGWVTSTLSRTEIAELTTRNVELRLGETLAALVESDSRDGWGAARRAVAFKQRWRVALTAPRPVRPHAHARVRL